MRWLRVLALPVALLLGLTYNLIRYAVSEVRTVWPIVVRCVWHGVKF
jgi:hypothetical protein